MIRDVFCPYCQDRSSKTGVFAERRRSDLLWLCSSCGAKIKGVWVSDSIGARIRADRKILESRGYRVPPPAVKIQGDQLPKSKAQRLAVAKDHSQPARVLAELYRVDDSETICRALIRHPNTDNETLGSIYELSLQQPNDHGPSLRIYLDFLDEMSDWREFPEPLRTRLVEDPRNDRRSEFGEAEDE